MIPGPGRVAAHGRREGIATGKAQGAQAKSRKDRKRPARCCLDKAGFPAAMPEGRKFLMETPGYIRFDNSTGGVARPQFSGLIIILMIYCSSLYCPAI